MKKINFFVLGILVASGSMFAQQAAANGDLPFVTSVETNYVGVGIGSTPDYLGSDDYELGVAPAFRYEFGDHRNVELLANYASANLINHENFSFGPALRYRFGRDGDVEDDVVGLLPEIDDALEAGVRFDAKWILDGNPRNRFGVGVDSLWDTSGTSEGYNATASARYWRQASEAIDLGIGAQVFYADDNFNDTYFGVDTAGSTASGLPVFDAGGGVTSYSIQPMMAVHLSENWHLGAGVKFMRLTGDAADSPVVDDRGDENQFIAGLGVIYSWGSKVNTASDSSSGPF